MRFKGAMSEPMSVVLVRQDAGKADAEQTFVASINDALVVEGARLVSVATRGNWWYAFIETTREQT